MAGVISSGVVLLKARHLACCLVFFQKILDNLSLHCLPPYRMVSGLEQSPGSLNQVRHKPANPDPPTRCFISCGKAARRVEPPSRRHPYGFRSWSDDYSPGLFENELDILLKAVGK